MTASPSLASLLQRFFTERLVRQQRASPHTVASYRDAFRLLLRFAQERLGKAPSSLALDDLDAALVGAFLDHVEQHRRNTPRTRNVRLAAVHAFCHYVAISEPAHLDRCRRILAIPVKRHERRPIAYLTRAEIVAVLAAPDVRTWIGRRDRALVLLAIQTGLACPSSFICDAATSCWGPARIYAAKAKAASNAARRYNGTWSACSAPGYASATGNHRTRSFRPRAAFGSAATRSNGSSLDTYRPPRLGALP
jgi:Phage integrase, N-terminal SAM-like domain